MEERKSGRRRNEDFNVEAIEQAVGLGGHGCGPLGGEYAQSLQLNHAVFGACAGQGSREQPAR